MKRGIRQGVIFAAVFGLGLAAIVKWSGQSVPWGSGSGLFSASGMTAVLSPAGEGLSLERKLAVLEGLGFSFTEENKEAFQEWPEAGYADLLALAGWGDWAEETWQWSPTSDQVYALDTEVFALDSMYPDFFQGLLSISGGEVPITDVVQDDSEVDWEQGTGVFVVTLNYDGRPHTLRLEAQNDWLDVDVLRQVNQILDQEGQEKRYYAAWNSLQGITIFYRDRDWARQFEKETGCTLYTAF